MKGKNMENKKQRDKYKLRISRREIFYVDDEPEHILSTVEMVGEPIEYEPGIAGEFISRRSITFHDQIKGSGPMHGYVMANFEHGSVFSRFEGERDGTTKTSTGTWKAYRGTGKVAGIEGGGTFTVIAGERQGEYILEIEGRWSWWAPV